MTTTTKPLFYVLCDLCGSKTTDFRDYLEPIWDDEGRVTGEETRRVYNHGRCLAKQLRDEDMAAFRDECRDALADGGFHSEDELNAAHQAQLDLDNDYDSVSHGI